MVAFVPLRSSQLRVGVDHRFGHPTATDVKARRLETAKESRKAGGCLRVQPLALLLLAGLLATPASARVPAYISEAPGLKEYPEDDGLLLRQSIKIRLDGEGKVTRSYGSSLKVLGAYLGRHGQLDPNIDWNDRGCTLTISQARTWTPDGRAVDAKANSIVPNTAPPLEWATPYAHLRRKTVAHVGVEQGSSSVLAYTISDRRPSRLPLWGLIELQSILPILDQRIIIEVPEGTGLRFAISNTEPRPAMAISKLGGMSVYELRRRDVPPLNTTELSPGRVGVQRVVFSTLPGWSELRELLEQRVEAAISGDPEPVRAKVEELIQGRDLAREKLARLHRFVVQGVRTISWPLEAFDYELRPAGEVLRSSVGHPLDKAALLAAMLRQAGLAATVALASSSREVELSVPAPVQLDRIWLRVRLGAQEIWLDPTESLDDRNGWHLAGQTVLLLDGESEQPVRRPELDPRSSFAILRATVKLEDRGHELLLSGSAELDLAGLYNPIVAFDRSKDRHELLAKDLVRVFGKARAKEVFVGHQSEELSSLRSSFAGGRIEVQAGGLVRLELPRVPGGVRGRELGTHRNERSLPLVLPAPARERVEITWELPKELSPAYLPPALSLENRAGTLRRTLELEAGRLEVVTELLLWLPVIEPEVYEELRALLAALELEGARTVLLMREGVRE